MSRRLNATAVPANKAPVVRRRKPLMPAAGIAPSLAHTLAASTSTSTRWLPLFLEFINHLTIESRETGATILGQHLWGSQVRVLQHVADGMDTGVRDFTILKSRQLGETTLLLALDLFWAFYHPGIHGCIVIDDEGNRDKLRVILRMFATGLPRNMRYEIVDDNKTLMSFNVGGKLSIIDFLVAGKRRSTLGASRAYRFAHLSEVALYGDEEGLENFLQTLSETNPDRLYFKESTAKGFNHFYRMCGAARIATYSQVFCFVGWWARQDQTIPRSDPQFAEYMSEPWTEEELELRDEVAKQYGHIVSDEQLAWYRRHSLTRSLDEGILRQTQPWTERQAFISSGSNFFSARRVDKDLAHVYDGTVDFIAYRYYPGTTFDATSIEQVHNLEDAELKVWADPVPWGRYVIGVDPAYGRSDWNDSHAITVCRCYADKLVTVAEWGSTEPETYQVTWVLAHLASIYEDCYVNIEVNGPGNAIMTELRRMKQILQSAPMRGIVKAKGWERAVDNIKWYLYSRPDSLGKGFAYGIKTTADLKIAMMNEVRDSYMTGKLDILSVRALQQMQDITQDGSEIGPSAKGRKHDDFVFSLTFAHRAWLDWVRPQMISEGYTYEVGQRTDVDRRNTARPSPVSALVQNFFADKEKERRDGADNTWARQRGLRS